MDAGDSTIAKIAQKLHINFADKLSTPCWKRSSSGTADMSVIESVVEDLLPPEIVEDLVDLQYDDTANNNSAEIFSMTANTIQMSDLLETEDSCRQMVSLLQNRLRTSREEGQQLKSCSGIYLPPNLLRKVAEDILRMSCKEPGGLRGCAINIGVETRQGCRYLGRLECGSEIASTFELQLTLFEDLSRWPTFGDLLTLLAEKCGKALPARLYINPGYRLVKKRLYRFG